MLLGAAVWAALALVPGGGLRAGGAARAGAARAGGRARSPRPPPPNPLRIRVVGCTSDASDTSARRKDHIHWRCQLQVPICSVGLNCM